MKRSFLPLIMLFVWVCGVEAAPSLDDLLAKNRRLIAQEDSLSRLLVTRRESLSGADEQQRPLIGSKIMKLEMELFDLRDEKSVLMSKIAILQQGDSADEPQSFGAAKGVESKVEIVESSARQISGSELLQRSLPEDDLENLRYAEADESDCGVLFEDYIKTYSRLRELQQLYNQAKSEAEAMKYSDEFDDMMDRADELSDDLSDYWIDIYDNKSFAYSMAIELLGDGELLARQAALTEEAELRSSNIDHDDQSAPAVSYDSQKRSLVAIELLLAERLKLKGAVDSLNRVSAALVKRTIVDDLSEVVLKHRTFVEYAPIKFVTTTPYKASNPIPMAAEYKQGVIYRIQLGAYKYEQQPSIFRGTIPLSKDRALGFWTYYAGGFEFMSEAEDAVKKLIKRGFKRPEIVVWRDGVRRNLYRDPLPKVSGFNLSITGVNQLSEAVKSEISKRAPSASLLMTGSGEFVLSGITSQDVVDKLVKSLRLLDSNLDLSISVVN